VVYTRQAHQEKLSHSVRLQRLVEAEVEQHLPLRPTEVSLNRFRMEPNPRGTWERRLGSLRIYYDVDDEEYVVTITGVVEKVGNQVRVHGRVLDVDDYLSR
jgi:mRNA-degrading endonuclease RelE of RelBE toxin-antitoxin system